MGIFVKQVDDFLLHGDVFVQLADGCNVLIIDYQFILIVAISLLNSPQQN